MADRKEFGPPLGYALRRVYTYTVYKCQHVEIGEPNRDDTEDNCAAHGDAL